MQKRNNGAKSKRVSGQFEWPWGEINKRPKDVSEPSALSLLTPYFLYAVQVRGAGHSVCFLWKASVTVSFTDKDNDQLLFCCSLGGFSYKILTVVKSLSGLLSCEGEGGRLYSSFLSKRRPLVYVASGYSHKSPGLTNLSAVRAAHVSSQCKHLSVVQSGSCTAASPAQCFSVVLWNPHSFKKWFCFSTCAEWILKIPPYLAVSKLPQPPWTNRDIMLKIIELLLVLAEAGVLPSPAAVIQTPANHKSHKLQGYGRFECISPKRHYARPSQILSYLTHSSQGHPCMTHISRQPDEMQEGTKELWTGKFRSPIAALKIIHMIDYPNVWMG